MIRGLIYLTGLVTLTIIGLIAAVAFRVDKWPWRDYAEDGRKKVVGMLEEAEFENVLSPENTDTANQVAPPTVVVESPVETTPVVPVVEKPRAPVALRHKIKKGDTLYHIARRYYGDAEKWRVIAEANNILVPADLHVGRVLMIPVPRPGGPQALMAMEPRFAVAPSLAFEVCLGETEPEESRP